MSAETVLLPVGTVTFLFTDIEGSSSQWESDPVAMRARLARHDEIVRDAIESWGGVVFKHLGDGFGAAFGSAPDAVAAAGAAQAGLGAGSWPAGTAPRVRMGLHSGEASPTGGDYFGPAVNRAARVMAAANGGQIAVSAATAALCPAVGFRDVGQHVLAGVGVERLFVVARVGDNRPLRSAVVTPTNLAADTSSFVGRARDVEELSELIGSHRLVTVVGPGGIGKTRLVTETAARLVQRFSDGIWFCDLAAVGDGGRVVAAVAETVGARPQPDMELVEAIALFLQRRRCLIILDNCEHVLPAAAGLARRLVEAGVVVVATSRELLGVPGEQLCPIDPLDPATAGRELFVDRARQRDPHFVLDADGELAARDLCRRLDGMPLAIELAAARTRVLSPRAIADRLDDRFKLLRGGRRGDRHQTLRDTVAWSYELLTDAEAPLFDRLSVFAGGFTLDAVEAVCADHDSEERDVDPDDVLDLLAGLVDKSMVQRVRGNADRFTQLETLRQFGTERLDTHGLTSRYRDRHLQYFARLTAQSDAHIFSVDEAKMWAIFDQEWDNLRAAFTHALETGDTEQAVTLVTASAMFAMFAMRFELGDWADQLAARGELVDPQLARVQGVQAWARFSTGDNHGAADLFDTVDARHGIDPNYFNLSNVAFLHLGDLDRADQASRILLESARSDPRSTYWASILQPYSLAMSPARIEDAIDAADRALRIATEAGCPSAIAYGHTTRGVALLLRDPEAAAAECHLGIEIAATVNADHCIIDSGREILARATMHHPDLITALQNARDAIASSVRCQQISTLSLCLQAGSVVLIRAGDATTAARILDAVRRHGHQVWRRAETALQQALQDAPTGRQPPLHSIHDAADLALHALNSKLATHPNADNT